MTDKPQASYHVAVASDGLVVAQAVTSRSDQGSALGQACLGYLGSDPTSKAQAGAAALAGVIARTETSSRRRRRP